MTMGSHQSASPLSHDWLTPPEILERLGAFDLDPCCPPSMPWQTATKMLTKVDDGLSAEWLGRVWLNPPYDREAVKWLRKLADHGDGIALTFARTETRWFYETVWERASAVKFLQGRCHFHKPDGSRSKANAGAPSVLVAYGARNAFALETSGIAGAFVSGWRVSGGGA